MSTHVKTPIKYNGYIVKQSKYEPCGHRPMRAMSSGPSGGSNTVLSQNMALGMYKCCVVLESACSIHRLTLTTHGNR